MFCLYISRHWRWKWQRNLRHNCWLTPLQCWGCFLRLPDGFSMTGWWSLYDGCHIIFGRAENSSCIGEFDTIKGILFLWDNQQSSSRSTSPPHRPHLALCHCAIQTSSVFCPHKDTASLHQNGTQTIPVMATVKWYCENKPRWVGGGGWWS